MVDLSETSEQTTVELLKEIEMLRRFQNSDLVIRMLAHDRKVQPAAESESESNEGKCGIDELYILMERGECDLSHILDRLTKDERLTPTKLRYVIKENSNFEPYYYWAIQYI